MMWIEACIIFGIQWVGWIVAVILGTEKFYDFVGSATFIIIVLYSLLNKLSGLTTAQLIQGLCILIDDQMRCFDFYNLHLSQSKIEIVNFQIGGIFIMASD